MISCILEDLKCVSIISCDSAWISSVVSKRRPFSRNFILGNRKKSQGTRSGELGGVGGGGVGNHCNVFGSQAVSNNEWCVSGRVVVVDKPIVLPIVWTFAPNALPQSLQNLTVKLTIDGLTREVRIPCGQCLGCRGGGGDQNGLDIAANLTRFFRSWWTWRLPQRRQLLSLRVITTHPCFIIRYDIGDELGSSLACCFSFLQTETRWVFWSSLSSLGTTFAEMRLMFKLSAKMRWTVRMSVLLSHKHRG